MFVLSPEVLFLPISFHLALYQLVSIVLLAFVGNHANMTNVIPMGSIRSNRGVPIHGTLQ